MRLWFKLGWRNLWRSPRRTAIELCSLAGAVFLCTWTVGLQAGMYPKMISEGTRSGSGHVGLYREEYRELRRTGLAFPAADLLETLRAEPGVAHAFARVYVPGLARSSRDSRGAAMVGLDLSRERGTNPLLKDERLTAGRWPDESREDEAVMGAGLADELGLKLDRKFVWMAQDVHGRSASRLFRVRGLLRTGIPQFDKASVFVPRAAAAGLIQAPGSAHEIAVLLDDHRRVPEFLPRARRLAISYRGQAPVRSISYGGLAPVRHSNPYRVEAVSWETAMPAIADAIRLDRASSRVFIALMLSIVGLGAANTLLMSVMERVREFGVIRALGLDGAGIVRMIAAEAVVLGLTGSALGVAAGSLLCWYQSFHGMDFSSLMGEGGQEFGGVLIEPVIYTGWDWPRVAAIVAIMCAITLAASVYPALRALRIRPAEAMRRY